MVTITPQPPPKRPSQQPLLLYFSLALLIVVVLFYFGLSFLEQRAASDIERLEKEIKAVADDKDKIMEAEVLAARKRIETFSVLFADHRKPSKFFDFLEQATHPRLQFDNLELKPVLLKAELSGSAPNFVIVGQQIYILQDDPLIREVKITQLSLGPGGKAVFSLELSLAPGMFK